MTLTFTYANSTTPIAGVKVVMTESDGTVTILTTDANGQITLPSTTNTYTLTASLAETGEDPISLIDAIHILQYGGELRTLTDDQKTAADVNADGEVDILDAIWILQHLGELRTLDSSLIFLDANTGQALSETTFSSGDNVNISVIRKGDVDGDFDPSLITDHAPILTGKTTLVMDENENLVSTLLGVDADSDTLTYSITGGADKDLFTIDASTGVLSFIAGPDYEAPGDSGGNNLYDIEISVSDGSNDTIQALVVSVNDLNEKMAMTNKTIDENSAGATVGDLSIIDTAFGNENITYALSGDDAEYFVLEGNTIKLKSDVSADYETKSSYTLTVTATNSSGETAEEKVVVKITDVNEAPILATAVANQSNSEDAAFSFTVPITTFSDIDGDTLTYAASLSDGTALPSWLSFDAAARTFTGTPLNADVGAINVKITSSDGALSASDTFTLTVVNTNDDPTAITLSATAIDENISGGVIGNLTTSDDDNVHGDSHTYALSGVDADSFEVVNGQLKLKSGVSPNYETKSSYAVTVTSTDGSGSSFVQSFSLSINDVNEAPTNITLSANAIDENVDGAIIGDLNSSDEDAGDTVTYALSGSHGLYFEVVNGQLKLKSDTSANFEDNATLSVTVTATDSGGLATNQTFSINIADVNDAPSAIQISTNSLISGLVAGTVGTLTTSDEDSGESFTYTVSDDRFEIVDGLLKLKAGQSIDYNNEATVDLQIVVTDGQGEEYTETFTIRVGDIQLNSYTFNENAAGINVGNLTVVGLDAGSGFTYSLSGEDARYFEITSSGILKLKEGFEADYERDDNYVIVVTAENNAGESLSTSIELSVNDVAEAIEAAYILYWGKNATVDSRSLWLKDSEGTWSTSSLDVVVIAVPEKEANEEVYLFTIHLVDADQSGTYNLIVKSVSGFDVSDSFRFDSATGAVYLKEGASVDFETSTGHYHAGTDALSYGHYGTDDPITDSVRPLIFSIEDDSGEQLLSYQHGGLPSSYPVYVVLEIGDTADDGSLEIGYTTENSEIYNLGNNDFSPPYSGSFVAAAGGQDITGDGNPDTVYLWKGDDGYLWLWLVPGGSRLDKDFQKNAVVLTRWSDTFENTPTDIELGDINGDGYADIIFGFGNLNLEDVDQDYNGSLDNTDGMVEILHGASLQTLIANQFQTWTTFLSPTGSREANFGNDIAIGDINKDGYDDIIIGAPYADESALYDKDQGALFIIYGQANLYINTYNASALSYSSMNYGTSIQYFSVFSEFDDAKFGEAVAVVDLNGDGIDDIAVSMSEYGFIGGEGFVFIYLGRGPADPDVAVLIHGIAEGSELGNGRGSLQNLGDVNGDGFDDLGMKDTDGRFFILWGRSDWQANYDVDEDGFNDVHLIDLSDPSNLNGSSISGSLIGASFNFKGVGDVNGDGYADFLISTPNKGWNSTNSGQEWGQSQLYYGQSNWLGEFDEDDLNTVVIKGNYLGHHIIPLGDFDNDGTDEFAFSSGNLYQDQTIIPWWGNDRNDENQPDPTINLNNDSVVEKQAGAIIGNLSGLNLQSGETINYNNITIDGDSADFFEVTTSGELKLKDDIALTYEGSNDVLINISGYTSEGIYFKKYFTIKIIDVNDMPEFILSEQWVDEGVPGAIIGSINIKENALDQNDTYTYVLGGNDAQYFELKETGELKLKDNITANFSDKADYLLTIEVTDAAGLTSSQSISISVNVAPTDLSLSSNAVDESHYGIEVGSLIVADLNSNDVFTYTLSGADKDFFEITSEGNLKLKDDVYADYEMKDTFNITLKVTDQGGLTLEKNFTIQVNDLNYATPYVSDIQTQFNVDEPSDPSSLISAMLFGCSLDPDGDSSTPLILTYSIVTPTSVFAADYRGSYWDDNPHLDIANPTASFEAAVDKAFELWGQFTGITFLKVTETATQCGDIRVGLTDASTDWAGISYVDLYNFNATYQDSGDSDIWLSNYEGNTAGNWADGTYGFETILHEIGHSLGLKHPHNTFLSNPSGWDSEKMPLQYDATYWTVMSYNDYVNDSGQSQSNQVTRMLGCGLNFGSGEGFYAPGFPLMVTNNGDQIYPYTPMWFDILAARYLYSYNKQTESYDIPEVNSGDDTYYITGPVNFTIFDTGGIDTLDFSTMGLDSTINLHSVLSYIGTNEIDYYDTDFTTGFIVGVYALNSHIENVNAGSGNDTITCNDAANVIICGPGSDTVISVGAEDSVYGNAGNDIFFISDNSFTLIDGGSGIDRLNVTDLVADGSDLDLSIFDDSQINGVEQIYLEGDNVSTLIKLTSESLLNFNPDVTSDQDGDGDSDSLFYIFGDSNLDLVSVLPSEGWTYFKTETYDWYQSSDGETYFATSTGMGVYQTTSSTTSSITNQSISENVVGGVIGTLSMINGLQLSPTSTISLTLGGEDAEKFEITSENNLQLKSGTIANFENKSSYNITVTLTYISGSETKTIGVAKDLIISVTDAEESYISGIGSINQDVFEIITGTETDDHVDNVGGHDIVDGKGGNDTIYIFPSGYDGRSDYTITTLSGVTKVKGQYDVMTLINVENIVFSDSIISLDTTLDNATYFLGTRLTEDITGTDGNDVIDFNFGDDVIDGKAGNDTLLIFQQNAEIRVMTLAGVTKIADWNYNWYLITLTNVENIMLLDTSTSLETLLEEATYFYGSQSAENIVGTDGDDVIDSNGGPDVIDGKEGNDTLLIFADRENFEITINNETVEINWITGPDSQYRLSTIKLTNVETIMFADQTVNVSDLTGQASPIITAMETPHDPDPTITDEDSEDSITLPDIDLWATEFDINAITLPETVMDEISTEAFDLTALYGLLGSQTDSLELNFEAFSEDTSVAIEAVKPLDLSTSNTMQDHYQDTWMEDLVYTSELG